MEDRKYRERDGPMKERRARRNRESAGKDLKKGKADRKVKIIVGMINKGNEMRKKKKTYWLLDNFWCLRVAPTD